MVADGAEAGGGCGDHHGEARIGSRDTGGEEAEAGCLLLSCAEDGAICSWADVAPPKLPKKKKPKKQPRDARGANKPDSQGKKRKQTMHD